MMSTNSVTKKVTIKGGMNDLMRCRSIFFNALDERDLRRPAFLSLFLSAKTSMAHRREDSKIVLSKGQLKLLSEQDFFFAKKNITEKIYRQLGELTSELQQLPLFKRISFPEKTDIVHGKISKGENYLGLPYIILDFPRLFTNEKILAFRTMIWWGNFASNTLLISGDQLISVRENVRKNFSSLSKKNGWLCIHDSPWHHHFEKENYRRIKNLREEELREIFSKQDFLKMARKLPIDRINELTKYSLESFEVLASILPIRNK